MDDLGREADEFVCHLPFSPSFPSSLTLIITCRKQSEEMERKTEMRGYAKRWIADLEMA